MALFHYSKLLFMRNSKVFASLKFVLLSLMAVCLLSGCDWVKRQLGMATSEDIARMKMELELKAANEKRIKDSIETARLDSLKRVVEEMEKGMPYAKLDKQFYVVLGSFKKDFNAENMVNALNKAGYSPVRIALLNGFDMVAAVGCNTLQEACAELKKIEDNDLCPYDVWIYNIEQGLHK